MVYMSNQYLISAAYFPEERERERGEMVYRLIIVSI